MRYFVLVVVLVVSLVKCASVALSLMPGPLTGPYSLPLEIRPPVPSGQGFVVYQGYGTDLAYIATYARNGRPIFMRHVGSRSIASVCSRCGRELGWGYTIMSGCVSKRGCPECLIATWNTAPEDNAR